MIIVHRAVRSIKNRQNGLDRIKQTGPGRKHEHITVNTVPAVPFHIFQRQRQTGGVDPRQQFTSAIEDRRTFRNQFLFETVGKTPPFPHGPQQKNSVDPVADVAFKNAFQTFTVKGTILKQRRDRG